MSDFEIIPRCLPIETKFEGAPLQGPDAKRKAVRAFSVFQALTKRISRAVRVGGNGFEKYFPDSMVLKLDWYSGRLHQPEVCTTPHSLGSHSCTYGRFVSAYEPCLAVKMTVPRGRSGWNPDRGGSRIARMAESRVVSALQVSGEMDVYWRTFLDGYQDIRRAISVDLLITSPPYLNNYHYNRNTRPGDAAIGWDSAVLAKGPKRLEKLNFTYWQNARDSGTR